MTAIDNILKVPFDQYSRQVTAYKIIDGLRKKNQSFNILDIGGYKGLTKDLNDHDHVTVLDVYDVKEDGYEKGDARKIDHSDSSFDFVVSFDVLEHIEKKDREAVLSEAARVAKIGVIFAAPVYSRENSAAEKELNNLYIDIHGEDHPWLKEHIEYGIPESKVPASTLDSLGLLVVTAGSNKLTSWVQMQSAIFMATKYPEAAMYLPGLHESYNSLGVDTSEGVEGYYRQITIGLKDKKDYTKVSSILRRQHSEDRHEEILVNMMIARYFESGMRELKMAFEKQLKTSIDLSEQRAKELQIIKQLQLQKSNPGRIEQLMKKRK